MSEDPDRGATARGAKPGRASGARRATWATVVVVLLLLAAALPASAQRRLALVIGNGDYGNENRLSNPVNDARLMAMTLEGLGFSVDLRVNMPKRDMELAIARFTRESNGADSAVLFYAGHGAQLVGGGRNFLLPVDVRIDGDDTLQTDGIPADRIVEQLERSPNPAKLRLVILDACRNNSLAGKARSGIRGLARMTPSSDYTLIAFSTNDQDVALDGTGAHSPYTQALVRHLARAKELPLRRIFEMTATDVRKATSNQQRPRTYGDLDSRAMLDGRLADPMASQSEAQAAPVVASLPSQGPTPPTDEQVEVQAWTEVKKAGIAAGYRAYLSEYPGGRFTRFARIELARLEAVAPVVRAPGHAPLSPSAKGPVSPSAGSGSAATVPAAIGGVKADKSAAPELAGAERPASPVLVAIAPIAPSPQRVVTPAIAQLVPAPGRVYRYRVLDRTLGRTRELQRTVTSIEAGRLVFGNGSRVEDAQGQLLAAIGAAGHDFEQLEPPTGWSVLLQDAGSAVPSEWTGRDGLVLAMNPPHRQAGVVDVGGQPVDAVLVTWEGRGQWPGDLATGSNYAIRFEVALEPHSRRVLRLKSVINAPSSGLVGFRNSSEEAVLVTSP